MNSWVVADPTIDASLLMLGKKRDVFDVHDSAREKIMAVTWRLGELKESQPTFASCQALPFFTGNESS